MEPTLNIEEIRDHRIRDDGTIEFKVHWENADQDLDSWISLDEFIIRHDNLYKDYLAANDITSIPVRANGMPSPINLS